MGGRPDEELLGVKCAVPGRYLIHCICMIAKSSNFEPLKRSFSFMNKLFFAFFVLLIIGVSCKKKQADVLADAKKNYEKINKQINEYTKKQVDDISSPEGGRITGYFREEEIKKMYVQHFGEKSRSFTEYYFDDGNLIYMLRQEFIYNKPNTYTEEKAKEANDSVWYDDKKTKLELSAFYFNDNNLIKWVGPGGTDIAVNTPEFVSKGPILLAEALIAMKQLKEE